jgi:hypothetical protein
MSAGSLAAGLAGLSVAAPTAPEPAPKKRYVRSPQAETEAVMWRAWLARTDIPADDVDRKWLLKNPQLWKEFE